MKGRREARVALAVDAVFPASALVDVARAFRARWPDAELVLYTEVLSAVTALVSSGVCALGVCGPAADARGLDKEVLARVRMVPVTAPGHPLAKHRGRIPDDVVRDHVQIVLSERDAGARATADQGVLSKKTWRVVDLETKHALLRAGLGWGNLPAHRAAADLEKKKLVRLRLASWSDDEHTLSLALVRKPGVASGPVTTWLEEKLRAACAAAFS